MKPLAGLWHWSDEDAGPERLAGLDALCTSARRAGLDYITFKALNGAHSQFLTDAQLSQAKRACARAGLKFSLWQYVTAKFAPSDEASSFASLIKRFEPAFVFIDVEKEYESNPNPVSAQYAAAFRTALPNFTATIAPFGRADLHPGIDYKSWHDHGFGVAPQAYECDSTELTPALCAQSFAHLWPIQKQWTAVGFHAGALGKLSGAHIGMSLRGLPVANISGWYSHDATPEQMRGIASHHGPAPAEIQDALPGTSPAAPADSIATLQHQLNACGFSVPVSGSLDAETREALHFFCLGWCGEHSLQDGDGGQPTPQTRDALAWAARHGGALGSKAMNFHYQEFRLDNTGDPRVQRTVGLAAQAYRNKFGPTTILSSARSVAHNQAIGGASDSRHLFPKHWDAIDPSPQEKSITDVQGIAAWSGIGHHAAAPQSVDHLDLRPGFSGASPSVFADH